MVGAWAEDGICLLASALSEDRCGATRACSAEQAAREGQGPMANMGRSPIPHYYNGVVWGESSCGGHKERHRKVRKWREMQRAVRKSKKAVWGARSDAEEQGKAQGAIWLATQSGRRRKVKGQ